MRDVSLDPNAWLRFRICSRCGDRSFLNPCPSCETFAEMIARLGTGTA